MADNDFTYLDQRIFSMAAMLDTQIRFHSTQSNLDQMEKDYLQIWLKKERDPLLVTIIATMTGDRTLDPNAAPQEEEQAA